MLKGCHTLFVVLNGVKHLVSGGLRFFITFRMTNRETCYFTFRMTYNFSKYEWFQTRTGKYIILLDK